MDKEYIETHADFLFQFFMLGYKYAIRVLTGNIHTAHNHRDKMKEFFMEEAIKVGLLADGHRTKPPALDNNASKIIPEICRRFKIAQSELKSKSRKTRIVNARSVAMYLYRHMTEMPLDEIGQIFNRHHSTVVNSIEVVRRDRALVKAAIIIREKLMP